MTDDIKQAVELAHDWLGYGTRFGIAEEVRHGAITEEHLALVARALLSLADVAAHVRPVVEAARWWREHAQVDYCDWLVRADVHISLRAEQAIAMAVDELNGQEEAALTAAMDAAGKPS